MSERLFALVERERVKRPTSNFVGLPPELSGGHDYRVALPLPDVVVIETREDGVFLDRLTESGEFGGDSWHQSVAEAKRQATFEYGDALGEWVEIPAEELDAEDYAVRAIREL
jgi:hypothetical protein